MTSWIEDQLKNSYRRMHKGGESRENWYSWQNLPIDKPTRI